MNSKIRYKLKKNHNLIFEFAGKPKNNLIKRVNSKNENITLIHNGAEICTVSLKEFNDNFEEDLNEPKIFESKVEESIFEITTNFKEIKSLLLQFSKEERNNEISKTRFNKYIHKISKLCGQMTQKRSQIKYYKDDENYD